MADLTYSVPEVIAFLEARARIHNAGIALRFPCPFLFGKIERKFRDELKEFFEMQGTVLTEMAEAKQAIRTEDSIFVLPEFTGVYTERMKSVTPETITITNVRKPKLSEMGDVALTDAQSAGLQPFIDDSE